MRLKFKATKTAIILFLIGIVLLIFFVYQNNAIDITDYDYTNPKLPKGFHGYKIVQVSDLHNKNYHGRLSAKVKGIRPDIIVITGDLIDRRNTKIDTAIKFVLHAVETAPTYYVSGNHEQLSGKYDILKKKLEESGVQVIDDSFTVLTQNGDKIGLMGVADPSVQQEERTYFRYDNSRYFRDNLRRLSEYAATDFNILLSHRPEQFDIYRDMNIDLVFAGHAHGGQIRIPFVGGIFAPSQGLFPKYTDGIYKDGGTSMVVSRGLGNSIFPLRVFNKPELVVVTLRKGSEYNEE